MKIFTSPRLGHLAVCALLASGLGVTAAGQIPAPSTDATARADQVLADVRQALGGEKLAAVTSVVASGRTRRVRGDNLVPIEFEIFIQLPDKYVRVDEFPAEDADPTSSGFNGDALIQVPPPAAMGPGAGRSGGAGAPAPARPDAGKPAQAPDGSPAPSPAGPPAPAGPRAGPAPGGPQPPGPGAGPAGGRGPARDPRQARLTTLKQDFARLALGLFGASSAYPLAFTHVAVAEAPQGQADVLEAHGDGNFVVRYFVDRKTRLPLMVTWTTPPTNVIVTVPGQPAPRTVAPGAVVVTGPAAPPADAPKEATEQYAKNVMALRTKAQATPVENRLYFGEYRDVDGLRLPFRLRRAIGSETTEETSFDRFRINARIDPRKFEPVK